MTRTAQGYERNTELRLLKEELSMEENRKDFWSVAFAAALTTQIPPLSSVHVMKAAEIADLSLAQWDAKWNKDGSIDR